MGKMISSYFNEVMNLKQFIVKIKSEEKVDDLKKSIIVCMENYSNRLEGYLLRTYNNEMLDTKAILLRGCIEAYLLSNIFQNSDISVSKTFYDKRISDFNYIKVKYGLAFNKRYKLNEVIEDKDIIHKRDRFDFIGSEDNYPNSLIELVDYSNLDNNTKLSLKFWIKLCDDTVHPRFNVNHIKIDFSEAVFGDDGIIRQLQNLVFKLLSKVFNFNEGYLNKIYEDIEIKNYINNSYVSINHVYQIQNLIIESNNQVLMVLFNEFILNYLDLEWANLNNRKYLFYIKTRYILEFIGVFYILLKNPELNEIYKLHSMILSKDLVEYMAKYYNDHKEMKAFEKAYLLNYEECYNKLKLYFQNKYPQFELTKIKHNIKQTNGWAIGFLGHKEKAPKTIDLITFSVKNLVNDELMDYTNGLYAESCEYCHISAFSVENNENFFDGNSVILVLKTIINSLFSNINSGINE
ncbi:MAG: hypothetical protein K0Q49_1712 [Haloplasmataceae bacterium]|jgi:hypothetical protein|nr:hypothetical protein [Haloplasmataceae bacterium]